MTSDGGNIIEGKPCDICGHAGSKDLAATCSLCGIDRHVYCMSLIPDEVPNAWCCEECRPDNNAVSPKYCEKDELPKAFTSETGTTALYNSMRTIGSMKQNFVRSGKVKLITTEEVIMLTSGASKMDSPPQKYLGKTARWSTRMASMSKKTPPRPKTVSIKVLSSKLESNPSLKPSRPLTPPKHYSVPCAAQALKEFKVPEAKNSVACAKKTVRREQPNEPKVDDESTTSDTKVEKVTDKPSCVASPSMHVLPFNNSGGNPCADAEISNTIVEEIKPPSNQQALQNFIPILPRTEATWKGTFKILSAATSGKFYDGFVAYPPSRVHSKAYKFSKLMPSILQFKLLPRCNIWADIFQDDCPDGDDIALYIIPEDFERSLQHYNCLLEAMEIHDSVMCSYMDNGVEFLIFRSELLHIDFQRSYTRSFLWGVFHCAKAKTSTEEHKEVVPLLAYVSHAEENHETDMEIDMIGGIDL